MTNFKKIIVENIYNNLSNDIYENVNKKHDMHINNAIKLANDIIKILKNNAKKDNINWADVGSANKVADDLEEIYKFIK